MRILHLYKDYAPILGGIEGHIQALAEAQAANGHDVTVLVTNPGGQQTQEVRNGVKIRRAGRIATVASTPLSLGFVPALIDLQPEIAHLHFPYPVGEISFAITGLKRPYVMSYHSDVVRASQQKILRFYRPLLKRILKGAGRILISSPNYAQTSPYLHPLKDQWAFVPYGIDPQPFVEPAPLFPKGERLRLLFMGRHRYYKGVDQLLLALPQTQAELWIGGNGPMRAEWEALAATLKLGERIRFLGDISEQDLPGLYASADAFVLPSTVRAEAFGIVLLEAMASGLPCITCELGTGTSFLVQHEISGLVVPPSNPSALARAVQRLDQNRPLARQLGAAGRERFLQEFTLTQMVERVQSIYTAVLRSHFA